MRAKSSMKTNRVVVIMGIKKEGISPLLFYFDAYPLPSGLSDFIESHITLTPRSNGKSVDANVLIKNPRPHVSIAGVKAAQNTVRRPPSQPLSRMTPTSMSPTHCPRMELQRCMPVRRPSTTTCRPVSHTARTRTPGACCNSTAV